MFTEEPSPLTVQQRAGHRLATGASLQEVEAEIRGAIAFHLDGMREDGLPIPTPTSTVEYIELAA